MTKRVEQHSWHWYAHGVDALEGNEGVPSPYRGGYGVYRAMRGGGAHGMDYDPTRGALDDREHRSNAGRGTAYRARAMRAARG